MKLIQIWNKKISAAFSFEVISENMSPSSSSLEAPIKAVFDFFINRKQTEPDSKTEKAFTGKTYDFSKQKMPKFLIRKIEINVFEDDYYLKGLNLTTSAIVREELKFYLKIFNQPEYEKFIINVSSQDKKVYNVNSRIRNIKINQTKIYETNDIIVNFQENKTTNCDIIGQISTSSNIQINTEIKKPNYRVISKTTKPHFLADFIPYLNDEDLSLNILATGDYNNLSLEVNSNLDPLIKNVQTNLLAKKMTEMKREKKDRN